MDPDGSKALDEMEAEITQPAVKELGHMEETE